MVQEETERVKGQIKLNDIKCNREFFFFFGGGGGEV